VAAPAPAFVALAVDLLCVVVVIVAAVAVIAICTRKLRQLGNVCIGCQLQET